MKMSDPVPAALVMILLLLVPLAAGCLTIPGPEKAQKTTSPATTVPVPPTPKVTVTKAPVPVASSAMPSATVTKSSSGYAAGTCAGLGGIEVVPGQQCPGTWLLATDTFSCCSVRPVTAGKGNGTVTAAPFSLVIDLDDNPGPILP